MKRHKLFYVSALSMMLVCSSACNDEMVGHDAPPEADAPAVCDANTLELTSDEMTILRTMDGNSPKISQDEAISIAAKFLDKNQLSKSTSGVRCDVVTRKKSSISKSGSSETDTLMYVLNYGNNDGYALVCADIRVPEQILAYSETGSMDTETDNPGVQLFMDMAEDYMDASIAEIESKRDSLEEVIQGKFAETSEYQKTHLSKSRYTINSNTFQYYQTTESEITEKCEPLLRTFWHQRSPYNDYVPECKVNTCPIKTKHNCLAGCVAITTSQLMAYWKYPQYVNGVDMDWNTMIFNDRDAEKKAGEKNGYYIDRVAILVSHVGYKVEMDYGCDNMGGSGSSTEKAVNYLNSIGYNTSGVIQFSDQEVVKSLRKKYPVPIRGFKTADGGGHSWLLDGYAIEKNTCMKYYIQLVTYMEDNGSTYTEEYHTESRYLNYNYFFHCKWGWGNDNDGYYLGNAFNTEKQYGITSGGDVYYIGGAYPTDNSNFKYNVDIAPNIHR